jgi:hypothetical protein
LRCDADAPAVRGSAPEEGRAAAARRAPLEFVEKLLPTNLTSTDTTERTSCFASRRGRL